MGHRVTPRSIAYAAAQVSPVQFVLRHADDADRTQLHFALQSASHWRRVYDDFNYEEFYNFIVDYFEADMSPVTKNEGKVLLDWWNE